MGVDQSIGIVVADLCIGHKREGVEAVYHVALPEFEKRVAVENWADHVTSFDTSGGVNLVRLLSR
jgi:hypothetical protein